MDSASVKCNSEEASLRSDSFITSIKAELALTPKDLHLHETLLKRYLSINEVDKAFDHAYNVEFRDKIFKNNWRWYKILHEILDSDKNEGWIYQVLLLTVRERLCSINLSEIIKSKSGLSTEDTEFLYAYDQAIYKVITLGPSLGFEIFHADMLEHHKGQIALHSATFLFIKIRRKEMRDYVINSLMLIAWQQVPSNLRRNWLRHSPKKHVLAYNRWYIEGTYRCSQAGHYCLHLIKKFSLQSFRFPYHGKFHYCVYLYDNIATTSTETTYFDSGAIGPHSRILPKQFEVEAYDKDAQKEYPRSLHHMVWTLLKYEKMADFECTLFDKLNFSSMDSEHAFNKLDIYAFLYCVTLTARNNGNDISTLPANIESILCSDVQAKWWERAYEYYTNEVGSDLIGIDAAFAYGITVVRCMGNNKLDPELLYNLGCIFSERAEKSTDMKETHQLKERASLYYQTALLFLQKLINTSVKNVTQYRDITMFNYVRKDMNDIEVKRLLKECKIGVMKNNETYGEYQTLYNLARTYKRNALIFNDLKLKDKFTATLFEAKTLASKALNKLLELEANINILFYSDIQELIQGIEIEFKSLEMNSTDLINTKYSENESISATNSNLFTDLNSSWFEEYCKSIKKIIAFHFYLLESATNQVNDKIDKFKNVTADFQCLKRQITELEVRIFKNSSLGQTYIGRNPFPLPGLSTTSTVSSISVGTPRATPATSENSFNVNLTNNENFSVIKPSIFLGNENENTDLVSNKNYALSVSVPGAQSMFEPTRSQVNNCGVYRTPDQIYLDGAYLVPPNERAVSTIPPVVTPMLPTVLSMAASSIPPPVMSVKSIDTKDTARSLPVNVVITSSDPLPTCITTPVSARSLTIPLMHIKETPHNYQKAMPSTNETNVFVSPPVFAFPQNKTTFSTGTFANWNSSSVFKSTPINTTSTVPSFQFQDAVISVPKISADTLDTSRTVVDGLFGISYPNTSLNKSRTISEKSNTSVENYDPCPDFKPIVLLPAEIKVTTGEEDEITIFNSRAELFRFIDKQWKERGIGEMKLLKNKTTGKVRVLMRREQVHKICANHIITADMEIKPMKNENKEYFWVANNFADETMVLEKFCIRFKTADIALDFYNSFEKARLASSNQVVTTSTHQVVTMSSNQVVTTPYQLKIETPKFGLDQAVQSVATSNGKSVFGGFTFSSTPTLKPVLDDEESGVKKPLEVVTNKMNVFSGISFKSNTSSPSTNIFNITPTNISTPNNITQNMAQNTSVSDKLNSSDTFEEYEPNVDFKPVIPLPALVDQKTGEEDEIVLFEHCAKLLRFDAASKEWKERDLGNIKLLVHKDNIQKVRLFMRREQIMKVCCNHAITKDMIFQKMPNVDKAVTWCAKDFSEGELVAETLCLRFKTALLCDQFIEAVKASQAKMKDDSKSAKEEQNAAKQTAQTGFGDKFKPKSGSWHCDTCYTNNLETFNKCACCETPKPKSKTEVKTIISAPTNVTITVGWGDKFKPKAGSWECQSCLVRNEGTFESCTACNSPKDPTKIKTSSTPVKQLDTTTKFNFGIPASTTNATAAIKSESTGQVLYKTNQVEQKKSIFDPAPTGTVQFRFGMPPTINDQKSNEEAFIFDGTGAHKFSFGIPSNNYNNSEVSQAFGEKAHDLFGTKKIATDSAPIDFTLKKTNEQTTLAKPALLPTPQTDSASFVINEDSKFNYVFKPKMGKSPGKSPLKDKGDESDDNEYVAEDECNHSFTPVIPLPDKVEVVTGEENEIELYGHLAKLFRFNSSEWKERGKGIVKILKHKETGKLRVVMRRDQVLKICLNHSLTSEVNYTAKDEKSWLFSVNDFSEGELSLEHFCLRFKNKEIASQFKEAVDKAMLGGSIDTVNAKPTKQTKDDSDDVIFVNEIQATREEKQKASELMLPENFFTYKNKEPCQGCRGCQDDDSKTLTTAQTTESQSISETKSASTTEVLKAPFTLTTNASTPLKGNTPLFQSPTNSIYGTPSNSDKTVDTSIFRTPLGAIGSNSKTPLPTNTQSIFGNNVTNKENTFSQKSNLFSGFNEENADKVTSQSKPAIFGNSNMSVGPKASVLAPPKLSTVIPSSVNTTNNIFGLSQSKSVFSDNPLMSTTNIGISSNKSIFDNKTDDQNTEVKSIFGDYGKSENLFTSVNKGSIFGRGALTNNQPKLSANIFGSSSLGGVSGIGPIPSQNKAFESGNSIFGASTPAPTFVVASEKSNETSSDNKPEEKNAAKADTVLFSVDNSPSFTALSTISDAAFEKSKKNPDFKWDSEQIFVAKKQSGPDGDKSHNDSGAGEADVTGGDEEYDPHYAPIVPLPDKIVVTTGEEDEEKLFGERCKLYCYDDKGREWKERGIGEMKILYHPERKTYRFLLRREQVHKAVLNMLLHVDLELLQMKNSDRAWTWAGRNFAENPAGEQETLAVRFKSVALAVSFQDEVIKCVTKLQEATANADQEEKANEFTPLRLPKHLQESARADNAMSSEFAQRTLSATVPVMAPNTFKGVAVAAPTVVASIAPTIESEVSDDTASSVAAELSKEVHYLEEEPDVYEGQEDEKEEEEDYNAL